MQIHALPIVLWPVSGGAQMDSSTLQYTVKRAFAEAPGYAGFLFEGDAPLSVGQEFYDMFLLFEEAYNAHSTRVARCIKASAGGITEKWAAYFAAHGFSVSLADTGRTASRFAVHRAGAWKAQLAKAARRLNRAGAACTVHARVTRDMAARPEKAYAFYKKHGLANIRFSPPENTARNRRSAPENKAYADFLCRVFDLWYGDFKDGAYQSVRAFDNYISMMLGGEPESCETGGICNCAPLVDADGCVYPCGFYRTPRYRLGNVRVHSFAEMLAGGAQQRFSAPSAVLPPECHVCPWLDMCGGGCWHEREPARNGLPAKDRYCAARKAFFSHAMPRMAEIAESITQMPS